VRVLGLDIGSKTIGLAITDELQLCAYPVITLDRKGTAKDVQQILGYCKKYDTTELVIGLPLDMNDQETRRSKRVRVLGSALENLGLIIHYEDESFSTITAYELMTALGTRKKKQQQLIDQQAAVVILTSWLEKRNTQ